MRSPFWSLMLAVVGLCRLAHSQEAANTLAAVYLHSWYPELGPLPEASRAEDRELATIAAASRAGAYRSAWERLRNFRVTYKDPRSQHLSLVFEAELLVRQTLLASGGTRTTGEETNLMIQILPGLLEIESTTERIVESIGQSEKEQAQAVDEYSLFAFKCLVNQPSDDRDSMVEAEAPEFAASRVSRVADKKCSEEVHEVRGRVPAGLDAVSSQLFDLLVEAMEKQGRWEFAAAQSAYERGWRLSERKSPATAALWLLHLGDLRAAPYGSPLSMGFNLSSDRLVRRLVDSRIKISRTEAELRSAQEWYDRAAALIPGGSNNPELLVRAGFLAFLRLEGAAAATLYRQAATAAHENHQPRLEAMALGAWVLVTPDLRHFLTALRVVAAQQDMGTAVSLGEMALGMASRARVADNPLRAIRILDACIDALRKAGLSFTAIELIEFAAKLDHDYGRNERMVVRLDQVVTLRREWITQCERLSSKVDRDARTAAVKRDLGNDLQVLAAAIEERVREEGIDAWRQRRDAIEKEIAEFGALIPLDPKVEELKRRSDKSYRLSLVQRHADCATLIGMYHASAVPTVDDYPGWLQTAMPAALCDPAIKREAAAKLANADALAPFLRAIDEWRKTNGVEASDRISSALTRLDEYGVKGALALGNGDLLADWSDRIERAVDENLAVLASARPYARLYGARAQLLKGQAKEARDTLNRLRSEEPFWSSETDPAFRLNVYMLLANVENLLQRPAAALLALEWSRLEELRLQELGNGLRASEPASVELEMLTRQAAMGAAVDQNRIKELTTNAQAPRKSSVPLPDEADLGRQLAQLPSRTVVLVYQELWNDLVLWRLERNQTPIARTLVAKWGEVQSATTQLNKRLMNRESGWQTPASLLWKSLVVPAGEIPADWTIAILRSPGLEGIPFDTLGPDEEHLLIAKHPIVYLTTLMAAVGSMSQPIAAGGAVVVGQASQTLEELDREVSEVADKIGARLLSGPQARVADVTAALETARFAHIAAHAVIDRTNPFRSYLALADGPLEAWELFQHLRANELVVLSACDSSRGAAQPFSEGAHSLTSLALLAGVRRIVSSQWKANDYESRVLMRTFYDNLIDDPALALQQAKTGTGIPPHHFANFILTVRDPSALQLPPDRLPKR